MISIYKNRNFLLLWIGHFISTIGDSIYLISIPWLILETTGSIKLTSLITLIGYLPAVFFGLLSGVIVDIYDKKKIMIYSDLFRAILVFIIPISIIYNFISPLLIGCLAFFISFFGTFFYPSRDSMIPQIINSDKLSIANSFITISGQFSHFFGPLIASVGITFFGLKHLFTINGISFLLSMVAIYFLRKPVEIEKITSSFRLNEIKDGLLYINKNRGLQILLFLTFINNFFIMGPAFIGLPIFVREVLKEGFELYAYLETSMALGMIIGSIIFWKISNDKILVKLMFLGIIIDGLTFSLLFFSKNNIVSILILLIHGLGIPFITISRTTIIQLVVPSKYRGRLFSIIYMLVMGTTAISIFFTGTLLEMIDAETLFLLIGIFASGSSILCLHPEVKKITDKNY
tara:strand:+ start:32 stop:1240 length:1209 start_codon:yes stop_codon:yes gene_type:complete